MIDYYALFPWGVRRQQSSKRFPHTYASEGKIINPGSYDDMHFFFGGVCVLLLRRMVWYYRATMDITPGYVVA